MAISVDRKKYFPAFAENAPRMMREFIPLLGTLEVPGPKSNGTIMGWAKEVEEKTGFKLGYSTDSVPWCGLLMAVVTVRAGYELPENPLWARNWLKFGEPADEGPMLGDVVVFGRGSGGHVGEYAGEDDECYHVAGGNQSDRVCFTRILKSRLLGARHPKWRVGPPSTRRKVLIVGRGKSAMSTNEQ